jgi:hypothetical protein
MATIKCPNGCGTFRGRYSDLVDTQCDVCGALIVPIGKGNIQPHVVDLVQGMAHSHSNIAAAYFDGPELERCIRLHHEAVRIGDKAANLGCY